MSCSTCTITKPIPSCVENLTIGTITADTEVFVLFRNLATGRTEYTTATSDADGLLILDLTELAFPANQAIELSVHDIAATSAETALELTIGENTYDCLQISFNRIYEGARLKSYTDITIEVYE